MSEDIIITLFGKNLKFKADEDVADAKRVAELLTREVEKVLKTERKSYGMDDITKLTQAALNIANDFVELQGVYAELKKTVSDRSSALLESINARL